MKDQIPVVMRSPRARGGRPGVGTTVLTVIAGTLSSGLVLGAAQPVPTARAKGAPGAAKTVKSSAGPQNGFAHLVAPLVQKYCASCHSTAAPTAGVSLTKYRNSASLIKDRDLWDRVAASLRSGHMPPKGVPGPSEGERTRVVAWIESTLSRASCYIKDPGRVTVRRLNRAEYNNTVRDLLGVNLRPADEFPSDDVGYGFDNIGDVLSTSPLLLEKYLAAAEKIAAVAIVVQDNRPKGVKFEAAHLPGGGEPFGQSGRVLTSAGALNVDYTFPTAGDYLVRVRAAGHQAGPEPVKMAVLLNGKEVGTLSVGAVEAAPRNYALNLAVPQPGKGQVSLAFANPYHNPDDPNPKNRDRNLIVEYVEIVSPPRPRSSPLPESHRRILFVTPNATNHKECARKIVRGVAGRAFRRPVTDGEVERLARYVEMAEEQGDSFERGIQLALQAILVSPHFLFRVELDKDPNNPKSARLLGDYELASRLSYFLWSSMPDDTLFTLAREGRLKNKSVLVEQARRMLKDPKARALAENFAGQWLQLRNLSNMAPDTGRFPTFNEELRAAMRTETEMFFESIVQEDRSILEFIDAPYTFLNERLAKHYGLQGVSGESFRRVQLADNRRGGLLTQASILTVTSNPTRTSPVKRGKWILEQILGTPPPPPPPNVPDLPDNKGGPLSGTLRQRMEQHRKDPNCASCHTRMDALGFGFENYDAVGAWRTQDGDAQIDPSGVLPDGKRFQGPAELKSVLKTQKSLFVRNMADKLLTYALGRGTESYDRCVIDTVASAVVKQNYRFSSLVTEIVTSDPFRQRRGDGGVKR